MRLFSYKEIVEKKISLKFYRYIEDPHKILFFEAISFSIIFQYSISSLFFFPSRTHFSSRLRQRERERERFAYKKLYIYFFYINQISSKFLFLGNAVKIEMARH